MGEPPLKAFCLDTYEVTVARYVKCADCSMPECARRDPTLNCNCAIPGNEQHPMNCVDWARADSFCSRAKGRLPTAAEMVWAIATDYPASLYPWGLAEPGDWLCWKRVSKGRWLGTCGMGPYRAFVRDDPTLWDAQTGR